MKLIPIDVDYCLLQFDALTLYLGMMRFIEIYIILEEAGGVA